MAALLQTFSIPFPGLVMTSDVHWIPWMWMTWRHKGMAGHQQQLYLHGSSRYIPIWYIWTIFPSPICKGVRHIVSCIFLFTWSTLATRIASPHDLYQDVFSGTWDIALIDGSKRVPPETYRHAFSYNHTRCKFSVLSYPQHCNAEYKSLT